MPALLVHTARRVPDRTFLEFMDPAAPPGARPREVSFAEFRDLVARAAALLESAGIGASDRVLLLAENSPEWQAVALAAQLLRAEPTALFASLGPGAAEEIARRVQPRAIFVSTKEQWAKLAPAAAELDGAPFPVLAGEPLPADSVPPRARVYATSDVFRRGAPALANDALEARAAAVREADPYLLLFTSGTTGRQKGVRLSQRSIVSAIDAGAISTGTSEADVGIHLLPFGHVAGHDQFALALAQGHRLVLIARRDELPAALARNPTYLFSVPLVYERVRSQALANLARAPGPVRSLLHAALQAGARVAADGSRSLRDRALARLARGAIGAKVRRALGGKVRALFSGGAPASEAAFRFFEGIGIPLVELYGMSETAGMISSNLHDGARRPGIAGYVSPDHDVRLAADGELQLRGPLLFDGYLDAEDDRAAFTEDGWFRTGDVVAVEPDGALRVVGRKKNLLVLSTGKKIAPEPLETALAAAPPFEGAVLLGEGRPFVSAIVFVALDELARLAALGKDAAEELLPRARAALDAFSEYERPKKLVVVPGSPQDHPALVTPTLWPSRSRGCTAPERRGCPYPSVTFRTPRASSQAFARAR
jgi:long-chain acyl-CoA synthetase